MQHFYPYLRIPIEITQNKFFSFFKQQITFFMTHCDQQTVKTNSRNNLFNIVSEGGGGKTTCQSKGMAKFVSCCALHYHLTIDAHATF